MKPISTDFINVLVNGRVVLIPVVRGTEIERLKSTLSRRSLTSIAMPARAPHWSIAPNWLGRFGRKKNTLNAAAIR